VLGSLAKLYTSLVWESTVLLALCSEDALPPGCQFGRSDMDRLLPAATVQPMGSPSLVDSGSGLVTSAMEQLTTESCDSLMDTAVVASAEAATTDSVVAASSSKRPGGAANPQLQGRRHLNTLRLDTPI
jgi:hypothetical protein